MKLELQSKTNKDDQLRLALHYRKAQRDHARMVQMLASLHQLAMARETESTNNGVRHKVLFDYDSSIER
jgi:trehalose-6-phosphatase